MQTVFMAIAAGVMARLSQTPTGAAHLPAVGVLLLGTMLIVSCAGGSLDIPTDADLERATYLTESTEVGTATLEDGELRQPAAPGSASELVIRLDKWTIGDIDGKEGTDAAAITVENPGGSGTFSFLHALVNDEGALRDAGFTFLGDRVRIEGVSIHGRVITVAMLDRAPDAPFVEPPTIPVIRHFRLENETLVEQGVGGDHGGFACDDSLPDVPLVIMRSPPAGDEVESGFMVSGCSRTFESNVQWRLLGRSGEVLSSGHATGGGVYGPADFRFSVEFAVAERQVALLEVFEEDVSGGEGFPPPRAAVPVIIGPDQ